MIGPDGRATTHIYTAVVYHQQAPSFQEEIKIRLPDRLEPDVRIAQGELTDSEERAVETERIIMECTLVQTEVPMYK